VEISPPREREAGQLDKGEEEEEATVCLWGGVATASV